MNECKHSRTFSGRRAFTHPQIHPRPNPQTFAQALKHTHTQPYNRLGVRRWLSACALERAFVSDNALLLFSVCLPTPLTVDCCELLKRTCTGAYDIYGMHARVRTTVALGHGNGSTFTFTQPQPQPLTVTADTLNAGAILRR